MLNILHFWKTQRSRNTTAVVVVYLTGVQLQMNSKTGNSFSNQRELHSWVQGDLKYRYCEKQGHWNLSYVENPRILNACLWKIRSARWKFKNTNVYNMACILLMSILTLAICWIWYTYPINCEYLLSHW